MTEYTIVKSKILDTHLALNIVYKFGLCYFDGYFFFNNPRTYKSKYSDCKCIIIYDLTICYFETLVYIKFGYLCSNIIYMKYASRAQNKSLQK